MAFDVGNLVMGIRLRTNYPSRGAESDCEAIKRNAFKDQGIDLTDILDQRDRDYCTLAH